MLARRVDGSVPPTHYRDEMCRSVLLSAFEKYEKDLLRFISKRVGCATLAQDIAHNLYLKLCRTETPPSLRDGRAYLFSMAANLATDYERVESRRREIRTELAQSLWLKSNDVTPEREVLARAELAFIEAEAAKLPTRCKRVFYLCRYEGWSQVQIADALGLGLTTVRKDLKLAMHVLLQARRRFHAQDPKADNDASEQ